MAALRDSEEFDVLARHAEQGEAWDQALTYLREAGGLTAQLGDMEAVSYYERALLALDHLPRSAHSLETAFDLHCDLRNALVPLGQHHRLLEVLKAAERLAKEIGDERRQAQIYSFLSNYYGNVGHSDLALEAGERSLVFGERVGATDLLLVGNMSAGEIYRTLGDYPKAKYFLTRAVSLIDPANELEHSGQVGLPAVRARSHLAWTLAELGDFPAARLVSAEAMRIADASNHAYTLCHGCLGLGGTRVRQSEFDASIGVLARGFALSEQVPLLLVKCGEIHLLAGEPDEATRLATAALRLATEQKERGNQVYATHLLAEISAQRSGASAEAELHYVDAVALATTLGMHTLVAHGHAGLARLHAKGRDSAMAEHHRTIAMAIYREMAMWFWLEQLETVQQT